MTKPFAYQHEGIKRIDWFDGRALLADDMGLGKTLQAILYHDWYLNHGPVIVICPAGLKWHWQLQYAQHAGIRAEVINGRKPTQLTFGSQKIKDGTFIINYDILGDPRRQNTPGWWDVLSKIKPRLVIIDEVHMIKDRTTIRYRAVKQLCRKVPFVIGISGTPATNCPAELWPFLNICRPDKFNSFWDYAHRFCGPKKTPWGSGWEFKGATRTKELNKLLLNTCMIRRRKEDVLKELPAKTNNVVPIDIEDRKQYEKAEANLVAWLLSQKKRRQALNAVMAERLVRVGYLRRLAAELKMKFVVEWIKTFQQETGRKLVVFGTHRAVLDKLCGAFPGQWVKVDGRTTGQKRQMAFDAFNKDPKFRLFVGNIKAAGVGWSCTAASDILFVELPWVPGEVSQATDRCHGVGRGIAGMKVTSHFLVAHGTIEERLVKILHDKQEALGKVMDGKKAGKFEVLSMLEDSLLRRAA